MMKYVWVTNFFFPYRYRVPILFQSNIHRGQLPKCSRRWWLIIFAGWFFFLLTPMYTAGVAKMACTQSWTKLLVFAMQTRPYYSLINALFSHKKVDVFGSWKIMNVNKVDGHKSYLIAGTSSCKLCAAHVKKIVGKVIFFLFFFSFLGNSVFCPARMIFMRLMQVHKFSLCLAIDCYGFVSALIGMRRFQILNEYKRVAEFITQCQCTNSILIFKCKQNQWIIKWYLLRIITGTIKTLINNFQLINSLCCKVKVFNTSVFYAGFGMLIYLYGMVKHVLLVLKYIYKMPYIYIQKQSLFLQSECTSTLSNHFYSNNKIIQ